MNAGARLVGVVLAVLLLGATAANAEVGGETGVSRSTASRLSNGLAVGQHSTSEADKAAVESRVPAGFIDLSNRVELLEDPTGTLTLADVRAPEHAARFRPGSPRIGFSASGYWLRLRVRVPPSEGGTWWLDSGNRMAYQIVVHAPDAAGAYRRQDSGTAFPFAHRPLPTANFVFPLDLPDDRETVIYMRLVPGLYTPTILQPRMWQPPAYISHERRQHSRMFFYLGVAAALALFNLFMYLMLRDRNHLRYVLSVVAYAWFVDSNPAGYGLAYQYLWPDFPRLEQASWGLGVVSITAVYQFLAHFVDLPRRLPAVHRSFLAFFGTVMIYVAVIELGFLPKPVTQSIHPFVPASYIVVFLALAGVLAYIAKHGGRSERLTFIVWGVTIAVQLLNPLSVLMNLRLGVPPAMISSLFEMLAMSLLLADRFNQQRKAKELAMAERERAMAERARFAGLRRFFSPAVAEELLSDHAEDFMKPRRREIVVVFVDLRGYTAFTDTHSADEVMQMLGEFHEAMGAIIVQHGGTLERFAGDGMMIFFNDPVEIADPAGEAVRMAQAMQRRFGELRQQWQQRGYDLSLGIGIAQGVATLGAIGFEGRRDYGAIGGVTNLAARLCAEAQGGQILLCERTATQAAPAAALRAHRSLTLKGFAQPRPVWEATIS